MLTHHTSLGFIHFYIKFIGELLTDNSLRPLWADANRPLLITKFRNNHPTNIRKVRFMLAKQLALLAVSYVGSMATASPALNLTLPEFPQLGFPIQAHKVQRSL